MKENKLYPVGLILVLILLIINFLSTAYEYADYQKRIKSGNERWKQVEERIERLEEEHGRLCLPNS